MSKKEEHLKLCEKLLKNNKELFFENLINLAYKDKDDSKLEKFKKLGLECRAKNGDADKIPLSYALYGLLWGENTPCNINSNTLFGSENISYDGDHLNTSRNYKKDINEYICELEKLGNFMPCPKIRKRSKLTLNQARNNYLQDRFDLYLKEIMKYYYNKKTEHIEFRKILEDNGEYFRLFGKGENGFKNFIEKNYLQNYINDYENILKNNYRIKEEDICSLNDVKTIEKKIEERGSKMYEELSKNQM